MARTTFFARSTFIALASLPLSILACGGSPGSNVDTGDIAEDIHPTADVAAVCDGPLPDLCEICSDGKEECAHWVREDGKCEVQVCPPSASSAAKPVASTSKDLSVSAAAAARPSAVSDHRVITDPLCPDGERECVVLQGDECRTTCVKDVDLCVSPPECRTTATPASSDDLTASAALDRPTPTSATGAVIDPLCPDGERRCVQLDGDVCKSVCAPVEIACIVPAECEPSTTPTNEPSTTTTTVVDGPSATSAGGHPICDPDGPPPHKGGCFWDETTCAWFCV